MQLRETAWSGPTAKLSSIRNSQSKLVAVVLSVAVLMAGARVARAVVHASIVVDAQTGEVLNSRNADQRAHPASLAKLMTLYITFEKLDSGTLRLGQQLRISRHASAQQPTRLGLRAGSVITVRAAILGLVTKSANDAAVVLAEGISGSESRFAGLMTRTAHELGMSRTTFYNASGLPSARQWTTARDMSKLALAILNDFPTYYHFFGVRSFSFHGHQVYGHNHLLSRYAGADGLKTGYIHSSGYNLVASAVRDERRLVGVVMGGATAFARDRLMMTLLDRGFSKVPGLQSAAGGADGYQQQRTLLRASASVRGEDADDAEASNWVLQVGGNFSSEQSVRRVLASAVRTAPDELRQGRPLVVKLSASRYRARFSGLTEQTASTVCRTLARDGFTCRFFNNAPSLNSHESVAHSGAAQSPGTQVED